MGQALAVNLSPSIAIASLPKPTLGVFDNTPMLVEKTYFVRSQREGDKLVDKMNGFV